MKTAFMFFRRHPSYPAYEVMKGIRSCGDDVQPFDNVRINSDSVAVTWNCYGTSRRVAEKVKALKGKHVVFENGYLNRQDGYYAMGLDGINGNEANAIEGISDERFKKLNIKIKPWNKKGKHILVCAQRGGGYNQMAMPNEWPEEILGKLINKTGMSIKYRPHPERQINLDTSNYLTDWHNVEIIDHTQDINEQIKDAFAVVVFTSNAANEALLLGIPVFYCGPAISCSHLALQGIENIEQPFYPEDREQYFNYLAHRQWHKDEIESGEAWRNLIH